MLRRDEVGVREPNLFGHVVLPLGVLFYKVGALDDVVLNRCDLVGEGGRDGGVLLL